MPSWGSLTRHLAALDQPRVVLSFSQIERVIGGRLPESARRHPAFWSNSERNSYSRHWRGAGYRGSRAGVGPEELIFDRVLRVPPGAAAAASSRASAPRSQEPTISKPVVGRPDLVLVGCVASKGAEPAPARDLYTSELFRRRHSYADRTGVPWYIVSAEHGLLAPSDVVAPYDRTVADLQPAERRLWGAGVVASLAERGHPLAACSVEIHAGSAYVDALRPQLEAKGARVRTPLAGLRIGEQLQWYASEEGAASLRNERHRVRRALMDAAAAVPPSSVKASELHTPGLYSWWADDEARAILSGRLGVDVPALIYVGQAGATRWPSGRRSEATLGSRIAGQHAAGSIGSSTFRLTIAALLWDTLELEGSDGRLDRRSNEHLTRWIGEHLKVRPVPFAGADLLGEVEAEVVRSLQPPLNLDHVDASPHRDRLRELRAGLRGQIGVRTASEGASSG